MKWLNFLKKKPKMLFILEYVTFCTDKEVMGVFDRDKEVYEALLIYTKSRYWCEGDIFSIYVIYLNDYYFDGLSNPIMWQNMNGTFFSNDEYRKRYERFRDHHFIYHGRESIIDEE
jgi:hypothetical protein